MMNSENFFGLGDKARDKYNNFKTRLARQIRDNVVNPSHSNYSESNYGYRDKAAREGQTAPGHFKKSAVMAFGGSGLKRETLLNSVGFLTKNQKAAAKNGPFMSRIQRSIIPGGAALGGALTLSDGGNALDFVGDFVIPEIGMFTGWHVGKNAGFGTAKALGFGGRAVLVAGAAGGIAAAATGLGIGIGLGMVVSEMSDSDSIVNSTVEKIMHADFDLSINNTQNTLTHKQRALNKLSKSALNDRGALLGNEAQVIAGIL